MAQTGDKIHSKEIYKLIKMIFLDVDGTMTSLQTHQVPESAREAIRLARGNGVRVVVSTGRNTLVPAENEVLAGIEFDAFIALNGQLCHMPDGTVFYSRTLDDGDAKRAMDFCEKGPFAALVVMERDMFITRVDDRVRGFHESVNLPIPPIKPFAECIGKNIYNIAPYILPEEEAMLDRELQHCVCTRWSDLGCDIIPKDGGKHTGVERVLARFGIDRSECMACGDGENDASMLRYAGIGVAMSSSTDEVKAAADFVAEPVEQDGIYRLFKKYNII